MGVLAPGSAHARPSAQPPIDTSGNFSAQVFGRGSTNLKHFSINFLAIFILLFFSEKKTPKNRPPRRQGGPPKSYFFCELKPHAKFQNPRITPSGIKVTRRREEKKNAINSGHLVPQPLGPK
jgi:hypothetical protein